MEERKELDAEKSIVAGLKSEELLSHLHKKVTAYLETQYHTEKGRMEAEQKFTAKFNQLLQLFPDKSLHPLILRQVCSQPIEAVIQSVGKNSIEFLFTQLNLLLNNKN